MRRMCAVSCPTKLNMEFCLNSKSRQISGSPFYQLTLTSLTEDFCLDSKCHQLSGWPFYHPNLTNRTVEFCLYSRSHQQLGDHYVILIGPFARSGSSPPKSMLVASSAELRKSATEERGPKRDFSLWLWSAHPNGIVWPKVVAGELTSQGQGYHCQGYQSAAY